MLDQNLLPQLAGGASTTGEMGMEAVAELQKALTAGYGTDVEQLQGGGAFRIQSLDKTMKATIQENKHFRLFNALQKAKAGATVDEWTEQSSVGGFLGGSTNTETGTIASAQGQYNRRVGLVKYMMTRREVSFVATLGNTIAPIEATEAQNGAIQLLTDAEFLSFEGDSDVVGTEFDGIYAQIAKGVADGLVDSDNIIDARGQSLTSVNLFNRAAATVARYGNFGTPTHFFCSYDVQADLDTGLDPAFRVALADVPGGGIQLGAPVAGIRTSHGNIANMPDVFVRDQDQLVPFQLLHSAVATANDGMKPTLAAASASNAASKFETAHDGLYYYMVTGLNASGQSTGVISSQQTVPAGNQVTLTITASGGGAETGYAIYRTSKNGTNAPASFRLIKRIPKTSGGTTTFIDRNEDIPGSSKAYILNMLPGADAINWRQLLPMLKFPLYATVSAVVPWAQLLFGYLRITKRKQHVVIKNIVSSNAAWKPFG